MCHYPVKKEGGRYGTQSWSQRVGGKESQPIPPSRCMMHVAHPATIRLLKDAKTDMVTKVKHENQRWWVWIVCMLTLKLWCFNDRACFPATNHRADLDQYAQSSALFNATLANITCGIDLRLAYVYSHSGWWQTLYCLDYLATPFHREQHSWRCANC